MLAQNFNRRTNVAMEHNILLYESLHTKKNHKKNQQKNHLNYYV